MAYIKNWRQVQPKIAHLSAVHWGGLRALDRETEDDRDRLERLNGFARHALQGRKTSDHHKHENLEQVYYILIIFLLFAQNHTARTQCPFILDIRINNTAKA